MLSTLTPTRRSPFRSLTERLTEFVSDARILLARRRRIARERAEFIQMDASLHRDLGVHPLEFESYLAESSRVAMQTRQRLARMISHL